LTFHWCLPFEAPHFSSVGLENRLSVRLFFVPMSATSSRYPGCALRLQCVFMSNALRMSQDSPPARVCYLLLSVTPFSETRVCPRAYDFLLFDHGFVDIYFLLPAELPAFQSVLFDLLAPAFHFPGRRGPFDESGAGASCPSSLSVPAPVFWR